METPHINLCYLTSLPPVLCEQTPRLAAPGTPPPGGTAPDQDRQGKRYSMTPSAKPFLGVGQDYNVSTKTYAVTENWTGLAYNASALRMNR